MADLDLTVDTIGDPVEASILLSQQTYGSADEAIIATAADGADALASGSLQSGVGEAAATDLDGADITGRPLFFVDGQPEGEPAGHAHADRPDAPSTGAGVQVTAERPEPPHDGPVRLQGEGSELP